jgi:DNA repair exonuclease SbcCD ATPase subunit
MENKNALIQQDSAQLQVRDIGTIEFEIISLKTQAANTAMLYYIEIGKRLTEAKALVPHGEWGKWLEERVEFEKSTANNLMKIYEEYGSSPNLQAIGNLGYTKTVRLLTLPSEEREKFVQNNDVENMSSRELDKAIKERDEALKKAKQTEDLMRQLRESQDKVHELQSKADSLAGKSLALQRKLEKADAVNKNQAEEIDDLKNNPVVPDAVVDNIKKELRAEAKQEIEAQISANKNALDAAVKEKADAEAKINELKAKLSETEKQVKMSNPDVVEFKTLFDLVQKDIKAMLAVLDKISATDKATADKLKSAVAALFKSTLN